jgi:hypothetical protein
MHKELRKEFDKKPKRKERKAKHSSSRRSNCSKSSRNSMMSTLKQGLLKKLNFANTIQNHGNEIDLTNSKTGSASNEPDSPKFELPVLP